MLKEYGLIIALICFLAINALCAYGGYQWADNSWKSDWYSHMLADAEANRKAAEATLTTQQKLITERDNATRKATELQAIHDRTIAGNRAANDRLRDEFNRLKAAMSAADNSGAVISSAAAATDRLVLAKLLESSHAAHGIVAEYADRNQQAVINCNAEYSAVRKAINADMD